MKTLKKVIVDEWVDTPCKELKWAVVEIDHGYAPEHVIARVDNERTAQFFVDCIHEKYPKDKEWFEVREIEV